MKICSAILLCLLGLTLTIPAQDITALEKIGSVVSFTKSDKGVTFNCRDNWQVQVTVLAPDLVRVRASFTKSIPARDHSWAVAKENWETPRWGLSETAEAIMIATAEIEIVVHRSPLLTDFRDARTHKVINADEQPMAYDAKGALAQMMFN